MDQIKRIKSMEKAFDELERAVGGMEQALETFSKAEKNYKKLAGYYGGDWRTDFEADEKGLIPDGLKRGVLSEDGLYDLLERYGDVLEKLRGAAPGSGKSRG